MQNKTKPLQSYYSSIRARRTYRTDDEYFLPYRECYLSIAKWINPSSKGFHGTLICLTRVYLVVYPKLFITLEIWPGGQNLANVNVKFLLTYGYNQLYEFNQLNLFIRLYIYIYTYWYNKILRQASLVLSLRLYSRRRVFIYVLIIDLSLQNYLSRRMSSSSGRCRLVSNVFDLILRCSNP